MTLQKEEPGVWIAYCDMTGCATRTELDCDCDDSWTEAFNCMLSNHGWKYRKNIDSRGRQEHIHICPDHAIRDLDELTRTRD